MAHYKKDYGSGSVGTSMQGRVERVTGKGNAKCVECKYLRKGNYCLKRKASAWWPKKKKYCQYFEGKGE